MRRRGRGATHITIIGCLLFLAAVPAVPPAAEAGTFTLVPRDHWAYDALDELNDTVAPGAGEEEAEPPGELEDPQAGERQGVAVGNPDEPLTRYELAVRIRRLEEEADLSGKHDVRALLDRLTAEFAPELAALDGPNRAELPSSEGTDPALEGSGATESPSERASPPVTRLGVGLEDELVRPGLEEPAEGNDALFPGIGSRIHPNVDGDTPLPSFSAREAGDETLRASLEKLSRLEADFSLGAGSRLRGELAVDPDTDDGATRLRRASAGLELTLSPATTLSTAYAIGRDEEAAPEHSANFDLEYQLTAETSLRAAYRLVNFGGERRSSEAEAEISIRF